MRCINRLIEPASGHIPIDGVDITTLSREKLTRLRRTKFGMVFQEFALFPHRNVLQNAESGLDIQGIPPKERQDRAMAALSQVGLTPVGRNAVPRPCPAACSSGWAWPEPWP